VLPLLLTRLASHDARAAAITSAHKRLAGQCLLLAPDVAAFSVDSASGAVDAAADLTETRTRVLEASGTSAVPGDLPEELRELLAATRRAAEPVHAAQQQLHDVALTEDASPKSSAAATEPAVVGDHPRRSSNTTQGDGALELAPATSSPLDAPAKEVEAAEPAAVVVVGEVDLQSGDVIQFSETKEDLLGSGGFGRVFRGRLRIGASWTPVAVKVLHATSAQLSARSTAALRSESAQLAALRHGNLVQLLAWSFAGPRLALMFELAPKGSLDKALHVTPPAAGDTAPPPAALDWPQRVALAADAACGLAFLHARGMVHADVKSANVLLFDAASGASQSQAFPLIAKLADFGFVNARAESGATRSSRAPGGSPGWMAPELWDEGTHTPSSDVYAMGCVLYELAARQPPWAGKSPAQIVGMVVTGKRPSRPDGTPDALWAAAQAAWDQRPAARPSAMHVERAMRTLLSGNSSGAHAAVGATAPSTGAASSRSSAPQAATAAAKPPPGGGGGAPSSDPATAAASRIAAFVAFASEAAEVAAVVAVSAAEAAMAAAAQAAEEAPPLMGQVSDYLSVAAPSTAAVVVDAIASLAAGAGDDGRTLAPASGNGHLSPATAVANMQRHVAATLPQRDLFAARVLLEDQSSEEAAAAAYQQQQGVLPSITLPAPPPLLLAPTATRPLRLAFKDADAFAGECDALWKRLAAGQEASSDADELATLRKALLDEGALRLVCDGVCAHARSTAAAAAGVRCLAALCGGSFTAGDAAQAQEVVSAATVVASAMRSHITVSLVQQRGGHALAALAAPLAVASGGGEEVMSPASAVMMPSPRATAGWDARQSAPPVATAAAAAAVAALRSHEEDCAVAVASASALHALARHSAGGAVAVAQAGAAHALVPAAQRVLRAVAGGAAEAEAESGNEQAAKRAASEAESHALAASACGMLACLARDESARTRCVDAGGVPLCLEVLASFGPHLPAQAACDACAAACDALAALAGSVNALEAAIAAGALTSVVNVTGHAPCGHRDDTGEAPSDSPPPPWTLHASACAAIRALAAAPSHEGAASERVAQSGAVAAVLRVMSSASRATHARTLPGGNAADAAVARVALLRACAALRRLCLAPGCVAQALAAQAPQLLTAALTAGPAAADADVAEHVCLALRRLCATPDGRGACCAAGAPAAVVASLTDLCGSGPGMREAGAAALHSLLAGDADIAAVVARRGAVPALVATLSAGHAASQQLHPGLNPPREAEACEQAAWGLYNILCLPPAESSQQPHVGVDIEAQHLSAAAIALCTCLRTCPASCSGLADACSRCMLALALRPGGALCVPGPAVVALVNAMGNILALAPAQEACCGCLRTLALVPAARLHALGAGAPAACGAALRTHPSHAGVAEHACGALANLTADPQLWLDKGPGSGIGPKLAQAVATAMRAHRGGPASASVQCLGAGALRNLAANSRIRVKAVTAGALESVVASLAAHPEDPTVAESAAGALWALATLRVNAVAACSDGAAPALVAALVSHGQGSAQCSQLALGALRCFNAASASCRAAVLDAGGLDAARSAAATMGAAAAGGNDPTASAALAQARGLVAELEGPPPAYSMGQDSDEEDDDDEDEDGEGGRKRDKSVSRQCGFFL